METIIAPHLKISACRACNAQALDEVIAFGQTPLADRLMRPDDQAAEYVSPLTLVLCTECGLCQIQETVEPRILFGPDYPYYSSVSPKLLAHFHGSADNIISNRNLSSKSLVVEAASNDGYMLEAFAKHGIPVLGIDPADGPVKEARKKGIDTLHDFFGRDVARDLKMQGKRADVFLSNNVLAHVADTNDFVAGIAEILADDGMAVLEFPYLRDLVDIGEFDTIYHQHLLYLSLAPVKRLFEAHGLYLTDAERTAIHGGSLRIFVQRQPGPTDRLRQLLDEEETLGITQMDFFKSFKTHIQQTRQTVRDQVAAQKKLGKRIAGYGAAAKATTLLHVFDLGKEDLAFVADKSEWKQGLEMPVTRLSIVAPSEIYAQDIDCILILAWNFADEIIRENKKFADAGGKFIVPFTKY